MTASSGTPDTERAAEALARHILDGLEAGTFMPGQRLVEISLQEDTGYTRAPIREALHILVGEGVVEVVPFKGARIRRLQPDEIVDRIDVLVALSDLVLDHALDRAPSALLDAPADTVEMTAQAGEVYRCLQSVTHLHMTLAEAADRPFLQQAIRRLHFQHVNREISLVLAQNPYVYEILRQFAELYRDIARAFARGLRDQCRAGFRSFRDDLIHYTWPRSSDMTGAAAAAAGEST